MKLLAKILRWTQLYRKLFARYDEYITKSLPKEKSSFLKAFENEDMRFKAHVTIAWRYIDKGYRSFYKVLVGSDMFKRTIIVTTALFSYIISPILFWNYHVHNFSGIGLSIGFFFANLAGLLAINFLSYPIKKFFEYVGWNLLIYVFVILALISANVLLFLHFDQIKTSFFTTVLSSSFFSYIVSSGVVILFSLIVFPMLHGISQRKTFSAQPELILQLWLCHSTNKKARWKYGMKKKNKMMGDLEDVALVLERKFPREIVTGDKATQHWMKQSFMEMANAIRDLKKEVVIPGPDTQGMVRDNVFELLKLSILNHLKLFPQKKLDAPLSTISKLRKFLVFLLITFLPLGLSIVTFLLCPTLQYRHLFIVLTGVWALVGLFNAIDPDFQSKIHTMQGILSFNIPRRKKNDE